MIYYYYYYLLIIRHTLYFWLLNEVNLHLDERNT